MSTAPSALAALNVVSGVVICAGGIATLVLSTSALVTVLGVVLAVVGALFAASAARQTDTPKES